MKQIAVIGAGVSGLACARMLEEKGCRVRVYERSASPGGLIRCERVNGSLFHLCGGHVFNTKNTAVAEWFWSIFSKDKDFHLANRNSAVCMEDGRFVQYPIENHIYQLDERVQASIMDDWLTGSAGSIDNFAEFLCSRFGRTLYELYFEPYNRKVWRRDLSCVPLEWLQGKLPMPSIKEMLLANINRVAEKSFVHSTFWYPQNNGSQFIADTLAAGLDIAYNCEVTEIRRLESGRVVVNGEMFDEVVFCGNLKELPVILKGRIPVDGFAAEIERLEFHGTTAVFCETDDIPYSWFYQPSQRHQSHRFICTGNFADTNNSPGMMTSTVEFTDSITEEEIKRQLAYMPFCPKYLARHYSKYTYPIQRHNTRQMVRDLKVTLCACGIHLVGRFAEWEYFNMDAAIASAMDMVASR